MLCWWNEFESFESRVKRKFESFISFCLNSHEFAVKFEFVSCIWSIWYNMRSFQWDLAILSRFTCNLHLNWGYFYIFNAPFDINYNKLLYIIVTHTLITCLIFHQLYLLKPSQIIRFPNKLDVITALKDLRKVVKNLHSFLT